MQNKLSLILIGLVVLLAGCNESSNNNSKVENPLPIYGHREFIEGIDKETVYQTIPFWSFVNQDGKYVGTNDYQGKPYVAYFFF